MTLPGYSAEASIYRSSGQYRAALAVLAQAAAIAIPQLEIYCDPVCTLSGFRECCIEFPPYSGNMHCAWHPCYPPIRAPGGIRY